MYEMGKHMRPGDGKRIITDKEEHAENIRLVKIFLLTIGGLIGLALIVSSVFVVVSVDILLAIYLALLGSLVVVVVLLLVFLWVLVHYGQRP